MLTNFERWREYTSGLSSPDNYINWGFYYTISASLQRRVWLGPEHQPCYPNIYVILVGQPGIGKGLVIREVSDFLRFWKLKDVDGNISIAKTPEEKARIELLHQSDLKQAQEGEYQGKTKGADILNAALIPICADAITYEALVMAVAESYRRINYVKFDEKQQKEELKTYGHSSLCFSLQELASLLRKRTNDTINYLLGLYDCPLDYEYTTLTRGKDRVRRGCLNILAGTTPSFMQSTFDDKLVDEGFSSRTFYIFAAKNRKNQMWIPPLTPEQKEHREVLLNHIKNLTQLYGNITIDDETRDFLQSWWDQQEKDRALRTNKSLKMTPYYSRKNIHVMKIAMAMHFGECVTMKIPLETFKLAIAFLEREEANMHYALTLDGDNPLSKLTRHMVEYLKTGPKNFVELMIECGNMSPTGQKGIMDVLDNLILVNQVRPEYKQDETTEKNITTWRIV